MNQTATIVPDKPEVSQPASVEARFLKYYKVDENGCWIWIRSLDSKGYSQMKIGRKTVRMHRWAYEHYVGPIPEGLHLDHLCRNRTCVNPAHLEPVTCRENLLRGEGTTGKNHRKTHCKHGHPFDEQNTYYKIGTSGQTWRVCRTCNRINVRNIGRRNGAIPRGTIRTHCKRGHLMDAENTKVQIKDGSTYRECRTCSRASKRKWELFQRAKQQQGGAK